MLSIPMGAAQARAQHGPSTLSNVSGARRLLGESVWLAGLYSVHRVGLHLFGNPWWPESPELSCAVEWSLLWFSCLQGVAQAR